MMQCHSLDFVQVLNVGATALARCAKRSLYDYVEAKKLGSTHNEKEVAV